MKKHLLGIFILTLWTSSAPAQDTSSDVPSLADIIGNMNASELAILENSIGQTARYLPILISPSITS